MSCCLIKAILEKSPKTVQVTLIFNKVLIYVPISSLGNW